MSPTLSVFGKNPPLPPAGPRFLFRERLRLRGSGDCCAPMPSIVFFTLNAGLRCTKPRIRRRRSRKHGGFRRGTRRERNRRRSRRRSAQRGRWRRDRRARLGQIFFARVALRARELFDRLPRVVVDLDELDAHPRRTLRGRRARFTLPHDALRRPRSRVDLAARRISNLQERSDREGLVRLDEHLCLCSRRESDSR